MNSYQWLKVIIYILLWIFTWTLVDKLSEKYKLNDDTIIKICIIGILLIVIYIQINSDINIS